MLSRVLALNDYFLDPGYNISAFHTIQINPGEAPQSLHYGMSTPISNNKHSELFDQHKNSFDEPVDMRNIAHALDLQFHFFAVLS